MLHVAAQWPRRSPILRRAHKCQMQCHGSRGSVLEQDLRKRRACTQVEQAVPELYEAAREVSFTVHGHHGISIDASIKSALAEDGQNAHTHVVPSLAARLVKDRNTITAETAYAL